MTNSDRSRALYQVTWSDSEFLMSVLPHSHVGQDRGSGKGRRVTGSIIAMHTLSVVRVYLQNTLFELPLSPGVYSQAFLLLERLLSVYFWYSEILLYSTHENMSACSTNQQRRSKRPLPREGQTGLSLLPASALFFRSFDA